MKKNKLLSSIIVGLVLYLISTGVSFASFSLLKNRGGETVSPLPTDKDGIVVDTSAPKTEVCPLNGAKFTAEERRIWETRRPLTVMVENHVDSRPPSGLSRADIIYEAVAEGGITRFLAVYYCGASAKDVNIAPVRSARIYFIKWAAEYGDRPIFTHVGGANNICPDCPGGVKPAGTVAKNVMAQEYLVEIGWRVRGGNDFDTTFDTGFPVLWRNYDRLDHVVATEHTMMASTEQVYKQAEKRGLGFKDEEGQAWNKNFSSWKFSDGTPAQETTAGDIKFSFWKSMTNYDVEWKYDKESNSYLRFNGGQPHVDVEENNLQLSAKNVVMVFVNEKPTVDKEGHAFYQTIGTGKVLVFQNGKAIEGTWEKEDDDTRTKFLDKSGKEISFVGGQIWIEAIPATNKVEYLP